MDCCVQACKRHREGTQNKRNARNVLTLGCKQQHIQTESVKSFANPLQQWDTASWHKCGHTYKRYPPAPLTRAVCCQKNSTLCCVPSAAALSSTTNTRFRPVTNCTSSTPCGSTSCTGGRRGGEGPGGCWPLSRHPVHAVLQDREGCEGSTPESACAMWAGFSHDSKP